MNPFEEKADGVCYEQVLQQGPNHITGVFAPDDRLFLATRQGEIKVYDTQTKPFTFISTYLSIPGVSDTAEGGILGMAFHPQWRTNNRFFVSYTVDDLTLVISEYNSQTSRNAIPREIKRIATINQPGANHNGGQILFGPDGYLYIFLGDGGGNAHQDSQDLRPGVWMGKVHRIDINTAQGLLLFIFFGKKINEVYH